MPAPNSRYVAQGAHQARLRASLPWNFAAAPQLSPARAAWPTEIAMSVIWTIIIGFVAGVIAKFIHPGPNEPSGFILTTLLGIAGAFVATYLGQALGFYRATEGAGLIGAVVGAIIVLVIWGMFAKRTA
jgi:uncharacterized membrane protein YeaQ/YmgE (transglycosylase-associated protein family)